MNKSKAARLTGFIGSAGATALLVGFAVSGTGAYFTDSEPGTLQGSMGTIQVDASGGYGPNGTDITFTNMLPGEAQTHTIDYTNTGANNQDVWVVFDQAYLGDFDRDTDTGLINDRGTYAEIHITSFGAPRFESANLNDDADSCPPGAGNPACNPLPKQILLASNLTPGASGDMVFSYMPGAKYRNNQGLPEFYLPYKIVATQHGIAPDNALN